jgi:hypothetical protein
MSRTDFKRGLSERELAGAREFRAFQKSEAEKERLAEDRQMYERTYVSDLRTQQLRTPKSLQVQPLPFDEWRALMPHEEDSPELRGVIASHRALSNANMRTVQSRVLGVLSDEDLEGAGFYMGDRPEAYEGFGLVADDTQLLRKIYAQFIATTPDYDHELMWESLTGFFQRNRLAPTLENLRLAFKGLRELGIAPEKPAPLPAPAQNKELNSYGVNLNIAPPSAEFERQEAQRKYRTEIVVTDPKDGKGYTQFQTDHFMDASTFQRLFLSGTPNVRDVIDPWVK